MEGRAQRAVVAVGMLLLAIVLVRTAWVCDDAFITFRVIDNALHGHGLRWNVAERVQVYTHPLWLLLLLPPSALVGPYWAALGLGAGLTLAFASWLALRTAPGPAAALLAFVAMLGAMGFVDFATSGLENPLAHLLLLAVYERLAAGPATRRERTVVVLLAALAAVDRLDHLVLVAPAVALVVARRPLGDGLLALGVGLLPLVGWEVFALVYYGFPLPNTAYAKVATGLPPIGLAKHGLTYLAVAGWWDPVLAAVIALGLGVAAARRAGPERAAALAIALWLAWQVRVGGDHMAGRFLTPAFVLGLWILVRAARRPRPALALAAALALLAAFTRTPPLTSGRDLEKRDLGPGYVADERAFYYRRTGLLVRLADPRAFVDGLAATGRAARARGPHTVEEPMIGWFGYYAGPEVHVVDSLGLADPLLARLPARVGPHRTGHYARDLPEGYLEVARAGAPLADPDLASFWADVRSVTRDPLLAPERWAAILRLNRPWEDPRVRAWCERRCSLFGEGALARVVPARALPDHGIGLRLDPPRPVRRLVLTAEPGAYVLRVLRGTEVVTERTVEIGPGADDFGQVEALVPPRPADLVRVLPAAPGAHPRVRGLAAEAPPWWAGP